MEVELNPMVIPEEIKLERVWRLGDPLGEGGFAKVYLAQDEHGESGVVKLVPKEPGAERELLFEELDGAPNVVPVLDRGESGDYLVLVMTRAEKSLRDYLDETGGPLTVNEAVSVLVDVVEALEEVEGRGVVHRDIKPENILLLDGHWCLADFGIARYAEATTAPDTLKYAMTRGYAAPEQWRGDRVTSAADVYAVGVVAYELITGQRPFLGPDGPDYRRQHLEESPEPITGIPDGLRSLVSGCLFKRPEARSRPKNLLPRLKSSLRSASPAGALLQQANAVAVERGAEEARQQSSAQVEAERRRELKADADQSLENILALLDREIQDNASSAQAASRPSLKMWSLNGAELSVDSPQAVGKEADQGLPFEVIAHTKISVSGPVNRGGDSGRSHSLWYCDAQDPGVFRWYETAFWDSKTYERGNGFIPFAMSPKGRDTARALSNGWHTHNVARPFMPIDQGDEESFVERWIRWFAQAAQGQLRRPSRMPESNPQGSWRHGH